MNKKIKLFLPFIITLTVIFLFYIKRTVFLKFYPPICNFLFFSIFFMSLFSKETVIQKIAKNIDGELTNKQKNYTRKLTYVWCAVTFLNFAISAFTVFMSDNIWILYNGLISYIFIGTVFLVEFLFRTILKKKNLL